MRYAIVLLSICAVSLAALLLPTDGWRNVALATHAMPCADLNGNGIVEGSDYDIVAHYYGQSVPPAPAAVDLSVDGHINSADLMVVAMALRTVTGCQDAPITGGAFPAGPADDVMPSIGQFRIVVAPAFRPLMSGYPGYDGTSRLNSPLMGDGATKVGRSAVHTHGSGADTGGTAVGTAGTVISDSSFSVIPPGFQGPVGVREVHTELRTLNLSAGGAAVRAGTAAPDRPISPGEVESHSTSGLAADDFPGESFFDVFVEVDLPAAASFPGATVYNSTALVVHNVKLQFFPPHVVYVHDNSSAVPVRFKTTNPGVWQAGDIFGYLVLAGHGANMDVSDTSFVQYFEDVMDEVEQTQGEMPIPVPVPLGGIAEQPGNDPAAPLAARKVSGRDATLVALVAAAVLAALVGGAWLAGLRRQTGRR